MAVAFWISGKMIVMAGSTSLIGGQGTTIVWAPIITNRFGLTNALEVGIANATLGLVVASLIGGARLPSSSSPATA
ncbi:sodium/glutamate symporter [Rhizobium grahamii CCGE 502]|uniref:Sodium/glutamate symporter n=1 Tax=Rhizobium grahamii CCGE 502 TaxID=990285 RepID=S3ICA9_9HYPH|nr:sodium/glutamate symporter [Rhizobium grahamii CCGE 502]